MSRSFVLAVSAALLACQSIAFAKEPPRTIDEVDTLFSAALTETGTPGAAVAIVENGTVVFTKGYGFADIAAKISVTPDTIFRVGSISKSFTSIAAMTLVEEGKLSLDARVTDLAPEVKFVNDWEATDPLRFAHLLEHTTGWSDITLDIFTKDGAGWTLKQGIDYASSTHVSRWKPGYVSIYSNEGPAVAGYILEKLDGRDFGTLARSRVLRPMGMMDADFVLNPALKARLAKSYEASGNETPYQEIILPPSGSLMSSAKELVRLVQFYLGRGTIDGVQILKPESVDRIERQETSLAARNGWTGGYGLGNAPFPSDHYTFRGHNGGIDSFTSLYGYTADCKCGFVILVNGGPGLGFEDSLSKPIQDYLMRDRKPALPAEYKVAPEELEQYAGFYQSITPSNEYLRIVVENLSLTQGPVTVENGHLISSGVERVPTAQHAFRSIERAEPNLAFVNDNGRVLRISPFGAAEKVPTWLVIVKALVAAVIAIGLVLSLLLLIPQIVAWARGRLGDRGGMLVRALPLLATLALLKTFALPLAAATVLGMDGMQGLAKPGPYAFAIMAASIAVPILAALGLWRGFAVNSAGAYVRGHAILVSTALLVTSAYMASLGWIGVQTWTW